MILILFVIIATLSISFGSSLIRKKRRLGIGIFLIIIGVVLLLFIAICYYLILMENAGL